MTTTVMTLILIGMICLGNYIDLYPSMLKQKFNFTGITTNILCGLGAVYIVYVIFNNLGFGFTLTYPQTLFIYILIGKFDIQRNIKGFNNKIDEVNKLKDGE